MPVVNCPIDIPEGWEFVAFRPPNAGERFFVGDGKTGIADHNYIASKVIIRRASPAIEVGDWVRVDCEGRHLHGKVGRVEAIDGGSAAVTSGSHAGAYAISRLIKQSRTIEPYTIDQLIAEAAKRGRHVQCGSKSTIIESVHIAGVTLSCPSIGFVSYVDATSQLTWPGGEAFGTVTWRDAK